jgi:hypothetical protein
MHPSSTRHQFLRLRSQGHSLASIGRQLNISKPTLIKWSRELEPQLTAAVDEQHRSLLTGLAATSETESAALHRRIAALKQELFSRSISELPTPVLETLLGSLQEKLRSLPKPDEEGLAINNPTIHSPLGSHSIEPNRTLKK